MEKIKRASKKLVNSIRRLPDKKQYVEFFTAILSVPVLITVILLNLSNLTASKNTKQTPTPAAATTPQTIYITAPGGQNTVGNNQPNAPTTAATINPSATQGPCKPQIGPVAITSPQEGQTVSDNPVNITIVYQNDTYCSVVWSYQINGGSWSDFDNKSIALYNPPQGNITLNLRVQSTVSDQQETLTRHFTYNGSTTIATPTPTIASSNNTASGSAQ